MSRGIILPVNTKPELDCYTHYSNSMAIMTNPTLRSGPDSHYGDMKWDFREFYEQVPEDKDFAVNDYQCDSVLSFDDSGVFATLNSRGGIVDTKTCFCTNFVVGDGSFTVRIDWLKKISPWVSVGIMLFAGTDNTPPTQATTDWDRVTDMRIGVIGRGDIMTTVFNEGEDIVPWTFTPNPSNTGAPVWLRITREGQKFTMLCSADGENFEVHREIVLENVPQKVAVGCVTAMNDDGFYAWFYQNHIQLHCAVGLDNLGGSVPLDFFGAIRINEIYSLTNPWLTTDLLSYDTICMMPSYVDFAIKSIINGYYVESTLNEYHLPFSSAYMSHDFPHRSMIYGFDLDEQVFYVLCYDKDKHYRPAKVPFANMEQAFRNLQREQDVPIAQTCLFKPSGPEVDFEMNAGIIKRMLGEYLRGEDSSKRFDYMRNDLPRVYGMNIYNEMISNIDILLSDIRIAYLLHEHKKVMCARIEFLKEFGMIEKADCEKLLPLAKQAEKLALTIRNSVIKYGIVKSEAIRGGMEQKISALRDIELELYPELIEKIKD